MRWALLCWLVSSSICWAQPTALRAPAVPLAVHDPYFSIWSPADRLTDCDTTHWTGRPHPLSGTVRVDGQLFRFVGLQPADAAPLPTLDVTVWPTRTIYRFADARIKLQLTFLTPALPSDLDVLARPVTYVIWDVQSADGQSHQVQVEFGISAELAVDTPDQPVTWDRPQVEGLTVLRVGSQTQKILARRGDDLRIDWGYAYLAARTADKPTIQGNNRIQLDLGTVGDRSIQGHMLLAYDDLYSIQYFGTQLRPYWRRAGAEAPDLLQAAERDCVALMEKCRVFDEQLLADLRQVGGEHYAALCVLAYRQTWAGNKLAADSRGMPLLFPKENFSNGCISTVDVLFPQAPFFLTLSPALTKAMLIPALDYAASPLWPYDYAPHDLGTYPWALGQVYGMGGGDGDRMPVEESGNMLIILAALAQVEGNGQFADKYWPMLTKWADYLVANGLDPVNQLCSADMFGHLPHCANLSLKAIIAIGGYAQLCDATGRTAEAAKYRAIARDYAAKWMQMAHDNGRTRLAFHLPDTWGMKHNLIWDRVLGLNLFPASLGDEEIAWYLKVQNPFGLPVDNRTDTSLIDWAMWSIAPAREPEQFAALVAPIFRYANETPTRVPLSDWFKTTDATRAGFQARPVVGGIFIRLLADPTTRATWTGRAATVKGEWAPFPDYRPPQLRLLVPTSQKVAVTWRYTLSQPAADWIKPDFDDAQWQQGPGGFGSQGTPGAVVRTPWQTQDIWLRREFTLPADHAKDVMLYLHYDESPEVYLNGVLAAKLDGYVTEYVEVPIDPAARATLKPGRSVLAVRCRQTYGGQYIDVGLAEQLRASGIHK